MTGVQTCALPIYPDGTIAGAKAVRQAVDASIRKVNLKEYAKRHKELNNALKRF